MSENALIKKINRSPDKDAPRLAYADWLTQQGDPWGEYIRLSCQRTELPFYDPLDMELEERATEMFHTSRRCEQMLLALADMGIEADVSAFRRGMLEELTLTGAEFVKHIKAVLKIAPCLRRIRLETASDEAEAIGEHPALKRIREFDLDASEFALIDYEILFTSPHLNHVDELRVKLDGEEDAVAELIGKSTSLHTLKRLYVDGDSPLSSKGTKSLAVSPHLSNLQLLGLWCGIRDSASLTAIADASHFGKLTSLTIRSFPGEKISAAALKKLFKSDIASQLTSLDLSGDWKSGMTAEGVKLLSQLPMLSNLQSLRLWNGQYGDEGAAAIAASPHLTKLVSLDVYNSDIRTKGAKLLAASRHLPALRELNLMLNDITASGLSAIAQATTQRNGSATGSHLQRIVAHYCSASRGTVSVEEAATRPTVFEMSEKFTPAAATRVFQPLLESGFFDEVRWLNLGEVPLPDKLIKRIAKLPQLRCLFLDGLTVKGVAGFCKALSNDNMRSLFFTESSLNKSAVKAILSCDKLADLQDLRLSGCKLRASVADLLAEQTSLQRLITLDLADNPMGDAVAMAIAANPSFASLRDLCLSNCNITDKGAQALADSSVLSQSLFLNVEENATISSDGIAALKARFRKVDG